jgi:hypothetical protein
VAGGSGSCVLHFAIIFESLKDVKFAATSSRKFALFFFFLFLCSRLRTNVLECKKAKYLPSLLQLLSHNYLPRTHDHYQQPNCLHLVKCLHCLNCALEHSSREVPGMATDAAEADDARVKTASITANRTRGRSGLSEIGVAAFISPLERVPSLPASLGFSLVGDVSRP